MGWSLLSLFAQKHLEISPCFSGLCQVLQSGSPSSSSGWKHDLPSLFPANSWDLAPPSPSPCNSASHKAHVVFMSSGSGLSGSPSALHRERLCCSRWMIFGLFWGSCQPLSSPGGCSTAAARCYGDPTAAPGCCLMDFFMPN